MSWLSRAVRAWTSANAGVPTRDAAAETRERIGSSRTESPHRDLPSDVIEWRWDGRRWCRWSALSRAHDRSDLPPPESLLELAAGQAPAPGTTYRLVDGGWVEVDQDG